MTLHSFPLISTGLTIQTLQQYKGYNNGETMVPELLQLINDCQKERRKRLFAFVLKLLRACPTSGAAAGARTVNNVRASPFPQSTRGTNQRDLRRPSSEY